jgi:type IV pilus assembly protein PilB
MSTPTSDVVPARPGAASRGRRRFLGEILVAQGIISQGQLDDALERQKATKNVRIGRLLIDLGYVTEALLADAVADQLRLPTVDLASVEISPEALQRVPRDLALKHRILPWMVDGRDLYLITADPTDMATIDAIGFKTGMRIKPVVAVESELGSAIERHYAPEEVQQVATTEAINLADQLAVGVNLRYRIDGALRHVITMPKRSQAKIVSRIKFTAHMDVAERRKPQEGRTRIVLNGASYDMRVSTMPTADGEKVVIRIVALDRATLAFDELGIEADTLEELKSLLRRPQGLMLVAGPAGSGKTTTLYAALSFLTSETTNIVTIEDPIEYRLAGVNQVAVSDRAGLTLALGLRSLLRQDPNVVMVGELRDLETAQIAFEAAQTGQLVLSTIAAGDAAGAAARLVEMGVPAYMVASSLVGVIGQRLVRRLCACQQVQHGAHAHSGCEHCGFSGYRGRTAVVELLRVTPRIRRALTSGATADDVRAVALGGGMRTMLEDGERKVARGVTTSEELLRVVPPREIDDGAPCAAGAVSPQAPDRHGAAGRRRPRILVVDADVAWTDRIRAVLSREPIDVAVAATPADTLAVVNRDPPDLIVMELRGMPGLTGLELLRRLRANLATVRTGVFFLTNVDDPEAEVRALDAGADDYLRAPVNPELLLGRVRRALMRMHLLSS